MITFSNKIINENKGDVDLPIVNKTILFTDIVSSSKLWGIDSEQMYNGLIEHEKQINDILKGVDAFIVKTIGDSFMILFESENSLKNAIDFSKQLIQDLENNPIKIGKEQITLRIGFSYGEMYEKISKIQKNDLKDYFGNTVGSASRMESKVSDDNGFAFSNMEGAISEELESYLKTIVSYEIIDYNNDCLIKHKRSGRLLTDMQNYKCENINKLKGVKPLIAYKCKLK